MSEPQSAPDRRKHRFPASLNHRLDGKLLGYSVAAAAAGVGLMALASPIQAQIVYTAANEEMPRNGNLAIDLNHDGVTDFTVLNQFSSGCFGPHCVFQQLTVSPNASNRVVALANLYARGLSNLAAVGPGQQFYNYGKMDRCRVSQTSGYLSGSFTNGSHYLGLAFTINGQIHYGWARFRVAVERVCNAHVTLTGYAYQTIPGEPIRAGETVNHKVSAKNSMPASLGALALGSMGLEASRRDNNAGR